MTEYNGFTGEERTKSGRVQTWAYSKGYLVRPLHCTACGVFGDVPGEQIAHLEDYTEPIAKAIFLCRRCHFMLHLRFDHPKAWNEYRTAVRAGWQWPMASGKYRVMNDHIGRPRVAGEYAGGDRPPILDDIHDGVLHPGPRKFWAEKMEAIMRGERPYWYPGKEESLF